MKNIVIKIRVFKHLKICYNKNGDDMNEKVGSTFSLVEENKPIPYCTISKEITNDISCFSLAKDTDISIEYYPYKKLFIVLYGSIELYNSDGVIKKINDQESFITKENENIGSRTDTNSIYIEIILRRIDNMNKNINFGEVFKLKELIPYQESKIINMDIVSNSKMKFVIMSFSSGTGLSEHAAPGEAIIFALEGEGIITYEGVDHVIREGENFTFAKGGLHAVKAKTNFKMALLLTLE